MSFVSYAQNFEDVMLWRALQHVDDGFYIDIGAQHPVVDSVSFAFYEHGWRGVHVEPTQQYSSLLRAARPDESVFQVAIGNQDQRLSFYEFADTGLSTADPQVARRHQANGFNCRETLVPVLSLDALLQQVKVPDIHWLKIDVEGLEKDVLESWQSCSSIPWVVVVESTRPLTQEESHYEWEAILLAKGYTYVYFDGLNRFYISPDHPELIESFSMPPNIFDGFVLSGTASQPFCSLVSSKALQAEARADQAEGRALQAEARADQAEGRALQAEARADQAEGRALQAEARADQAEGKALQAEARADQAEGRALQAEARADQAESRALQAEARADQAEGRALQAEAGVQQAKDKADQAESNVRAVLHSTSWRVTGPLRLASRLSHRLSQAIRERRVVSGLKRRLHPVIFRAGHRAMRNSRLKKPALLLLNRMPWLKIRLRRIILDPSPVSTAGWSVSAESAERSMSPRTARLYIELKSAIDSRKN